MCFGSGCKYENPCTGECSGNSDMLQPDATCQRSEMEEQYGIEFGHMPTAGQLDDYIMRQKEDA